MSSLYQPRPVLSTQRFSPGSDYMDARRNSYHAAQTGGRLPLRESTGNVQAHNYNGLVSCYQQPAMLSPSMPQPGVPAIVPSQSFDCLYRMPEPRHQQPRLQQRRSKHGVNPLYFWPTFRQYRNRQAHKDNQKDKGGVWRRPELEDAFVDAVLLMPHMGRRKFSMGGKLHGRNMLISEYIFVICVAVLGSKEIFRIDNSNDSIEQMGRKQVSSHMQVVKKFFEDLRCFHFLFPAEEKKEPGSTNSDDYFDEEEQESFKSNPVLTALAEGRVPEVKPNYEYFNTLLSLQSGITVRPKTCEIFVSSPDVRIRDEIAYDAHDNPLDQASFPHLHKYSNCDDSPNVLGKDVLLHEYTRSLDRTTSACAKTVTRRWQRDAPEMYEALDLPTRDDECLLMEMCATLELHEHAKFPSGSELTGFVEVAVTQPALQHHRWKCVTRLTRPEELHADGEKADMYTNESGIHRRGCSDSRPDCDCHLRPRQDIHVPFPAVEWASILSMAVQYPDVEHQRKKDRRGGKGPDGDRRRPDLERSGSKRKRTEDDGDAASWARREPTGSDLICKVAMYQELWSCAPESNRWTRQAIIFWRFNTTNQWYKYGAVFRPAGTSWRWLTVNDPMSRYHQQKALIYPSVGVGRDAVMSPTPTIGQHMTATMNETFGAWDNGSNMPHHVPSIPSSTNGMGGIFDSFSGGLATPPPTAGLHSSYPTGSFDGSVSGPSTAGASAAGSSSNAGVSFMSSNGSSEAPQSSGIPHPSAPYYDATAVASSYPETKPMPTAMVNSYIATTSALDLNGQQLVYDNSDTVNNPGLQGWDMTALDSWPNNASNASNAGASASDGPAPSSATQPGPAPGWTGNSQHQQPPQQPKMEPGVAPLWPGQWGAGVPSTERDSSPRAMKRRRTENFHEAATGAPVPVSAGW